MRLRLNNISCILLLNLTLSLCSAIWKPQSPSLVKTRIFQVIWYELFAITNGTNGGLFGSDGNQVDILSHFGAQIHAAFALWLAQVYWQAPVAVKHIAVCPVFNQSFDYRQIVSFAGPMQRSKAVCWVSVVDVDVWQIVQHHADVSESTRLLEILFHSAKK